MRKNICGRHCSFYRFSSTPAHHRTPAKPGTPTPCAPFKSGRPPTQGERGSAECVMLPHTTCRKHPRFALRPDFPSTPGCRACAVASPATSTAAFYNAIFPFITKIVRPGRFTFYCFHQRGEPQDTSDARHTCTLCSVTVRAASGAGRAWAGRVCHASTHSLSVTPTVRSSPRLPLHSGLPYQCCGQSRDFRRCLL